METAAAGSGQHATQDQADELESLQSILLPEELSIGAGADGTKFRLHVGHDIGVAGGTLYRVEVSVGVAYTPSYPDTPPRYTIEAAGDYGGGGAERRATARLRVLLEEEMARCLGELMVYDLYCVTQDWAKSTAAHLKHHGAQAAVPHVDITPVVLAVFMTNLAAYEPALAELVQSMVTLLQTQPQTQSLAPPNPGSSAGTVAMTAGSHESCRSPQGTGSTGSTGMMVGASELHQLSALDAFQGKTDGVLTLFIPPSSSSAYHFEVEVRRGEWRPYSDKAQAVLALHAADRTKSRQVELYSQEWGHALVDLSRNTHATPRSVSGKKKNIRVHTERHDLVQNLALVEAELARTHAPTAKGKRTHRPRRMKSVDADGLDSSPVSAASARTYTASQRGYALEVLAAARDHLQGVAHVDEPGLIVCVGRSKRRGVQLHTLALPPGSKPIVAFSWELGDRYSMGCIKEHWFGQHMVVVHEEEGSSSSSSSSTLHELATVVLARKSGAGTTSITHNFGTCTLQGTHTF